MKKLFYAELNFIPPSKANLYRKGKKGLFLQKNIKAEIDKTIFIFQKYKEQQKLKTINDFVLVDILFILPNKRKRDLDNIMKTIGDCLETAGIIKNDNLIVKEILEKALSKNKQAKTIISIYPYQMSVI